MRVRRGCEVAGDKVGAVGHGAGMRWVLMLLVILAAVMGGEARAVVVSGRAVVSERDGRAEMVEKRADALRVESERAFLEDEAAGLVDGWPLALWFPGGLAVARSDCTDEALEWDGENRLTGMWRGPWKEELAQVPFESLVGKAVEGSTVWRWGYDHRSRRVQRDEPGSGGERLRTVTVFSGGTSAAEYTETAAAGSAWTVPPAATVQHVRGPDLGGGTKGLLYSLRRSLQPNEQSTWLPTFNRYNGRGDVVAQSDIDGTTTWAASYQADGRRTAEAGTNVERHRACTKEEDPTGLLNEGFRYRDMETGTFISRDPLGLVDGPNVYCYVRQNPWTHWDPEGLFVGALVKRINEHIITPAAEGLVGAMVDALPQSAVEQLSSSRGFESAVEAGRTVSGGIMHGSQEALGMLSPMDGAADKLLKGDLSGAVKEAAIEAGGGRVFKAAGKGLAAVKRHAGQLDEAVGALSHADDAATATATGVRESIEEASSVLAKEGGGVAKGGDSYVYGVIDTQTGRLTKPGMSSGPVPNRMNQSVKTADQRSGVPGKHKGVIIEQGMTPEQARALEQKLTDKVEVRRPGTFPNKFHQRPTPKVETKEQFKEKYGHEHNR
jgi:RHS repeat-associated protein